MKNVILLSVFALVSASFALADGSTNAGGGKGNGPCKQIQSACSSSFTKGTWKQGTGLWRDCINPIMQGVTNVPGLKTGLILPSVDPSVVAACKAKHPKFGQGKVGS